MSRGLRAQTARQRAITAPAVVFGISTVAVVFTQRSEIFTEPGTTFVLLCLVYLCGAWVVWRPWGLKVADSVHAVDNGLRIVWGKIDLHVPFTQIDRCESVRLGTYDGVKITFKQPNALDSDIGFFVGFKPEGEQVADPLACVQRLLEASRGEFSQCSFA